MLPPSKSIIFNWIKLNLKLQNGYLFALQFLEQMLAIYCQEYGQFVQCRKICHTNVFFSESKSWLIATYTFVRPSKVICSLLDMIAMIAVAKKR
jgi:hypothetical protein